METLENNKKIPLTRDEAELRKRLLSDNEGKTDINYELYLVLKKSSDKINSDYNGRLDIKFTYYNIDNFNGLFLNFVGIIQKVEVNNNIEENFNFNNQRLQINQSYLKSEIINSIRIYFSGTYNKSGVGLHHYIDPADGKEYLYTQFEPFDCNRLFPCFDQPDLKAKLKLSVIAPSEWIVLSNENEIKTISISLFDDIDKFIIQEVIDKDYTFHSYSTTPCISSYLYAICAGPYYKIECNLQSPVPLRLFLRESMKTFGEPDEFFKITIAGMKWYHKYFGIPYPFNKYDQIFCPEYNMGAMENVGLVTYNEYYCWKDKPTQRKRTLFAITVLHELAHMWFGNLVTMKWWDDLWLNESFATFISHLCMAESDDLKHYTTSWLLFGNYKGYAYKADQQSTTHPVMSDVKNTEVAETHFDEIVYEKGSSILKQMYYFIGDERFSKNLNEYFKTYSWKNTVFQDFINKMNIGITEYDLNSLCDNWLKKAGLNEVSLDWDIEFGKIIKFNILQKPCLNDYPNLQTHMIDILFIYENEFKEYKSIIIKNEEINEIIKFVGCEAPNAIILNYNDWGYFKWTIDRRSINYLKNNLHKIEDLLTKQLVYRSLFDLTRDSRISSIEYLEMITNLIIKETNEDIIATVIRSVQGIISNYLPNKFYSEYTSKLFDLIKSLIVNNKDNNEIILNLIDFLISFSFTEEHITYIKNWLLDGISIEGIKFQDEFLTQENRFKIVKLIHRSKIITNLEKEEFLSNEIKRDNNSDSSVLAKLACYASRPEKSIKEELWNKFVNQSNSDSLYNMETLMQNFSSRDQLEITEEYMRTKFFEVLLNVGKNNEFFYVRSFIDNLSPIYWVNEDSIEKLEKLSDDVKNLDAVFKCVLETKDDMKRMLTAHKLCEEYLNK